MTTFPGISPVIKNYNRAENAFFSRIVTVPLSQEKNVVCKPLVFEGQTVEEGQIIAESEDSLKAKIHSPVPGKVIDFISVKNPDGRPVVAVRIKFEGSFSYTGKQRIETNWKELAPSSIQKTLSEMGIINTYHVMEVVSLSQQVNKARQTKIKNVAVRLFDEDPVRITDTLISKLYSEEILVGARIIAKAIDAEQIIYFFGNKKSAESSFISKDYLKNEKIVVMNSKKYPSGFKKEACQFYNRNIKKTSGISLSESDLFIDSSTLLDVYKAVVNQIPVITKTVHFSGDCLPVKTLLNVRIGTTLKDVINQLGGFIKPPSMVVVNGHLTGYSVNSLDIPVSKFVKSVSFVSNKRTPETLMYSCISCGNCRSICSRKLAPDLLYLYKVEKYALQEEYIASASTCSECGLCNTVCPSRIPLAQIIGSLKPNKILKEEVINEK